MSKRGHERKIQREENKVSYRAACSYCGTLSHSHTSQDDAERLIRNHEQRCEDNPDNDPFAWREE